jgi:hypothetical protein
MMSNGLLKSALAQLANMVPSGRSPVVEAANPKRCGFDIASGSPLAAFDPHELHQLTGFPEVWAFEKRYAK